MLQSIWPKICLGIIQDPSTRTLPLLALCHHYRSPSCRHTQITTTPTNCNVPILIHRTTRTQRDWSRFRLHIPSQNGIPSRSTQRHWPRVTGFKLSSEKVNRSLLSKKASPTENPIQYNIPFYCPFWQLQNRSTSEVNPIATIKIRVNFHYLNGIFTKVIATSLVRLTPKGDVFIFTNHMNLDLAFSNNWINRFEIFHRIDNKPSCLEFAMNTNLIPCK